MLSVWSFLVASKMVDMVAEFVVAPILAAGVNCICLAVHREDTSGLGISTDAFDRIPSLHTKVRNGAMILTW